jgi:hypothetical protein
MLCRYCACALPPEARKPLCRACRRTHVCRTCHAEWEAPFRGLRCPACVAALAASGGGPRPPRAARPARVAALAERARLGLPLFGEGVGRP